jgi:poly(hydroxyalkanoate) depolymerase family esterase
MGSLHAMCVVIASAAIGQGCAAELADDGGEADDWDRDPLAAPDAIAAESSADALLGADGSTSPTGHWVEGDAVTADGSRHYWLWVPRAYRGGPLPLVMHLHGAVEDHAAADAYARWTELADERGFFVLYPVQPASPDNPLAAWRSFEPDHRQRGAGEAGILAAAVHDVRARYAIAARRTYAVGLSAGAGMAVAMAATYPDLFAAVGVHSGWEYAIADDQVEWQVHVKTGGPPPDEAGELAFHAMGDHARRMRVAVFHGDADAVTLPPTGDQVGAQWAQTNDLVDDGLDNDTVQLASPDHVDGAVPGGHTYTIDCYADASGRPLIEYWFVHGLGHMWSGGSDPTVSDPLGPDATAALWRFFTSPSTSSCAL